MSEHDDDHTAPWDPALGRRTLLRAGGALGAAGAAGTVGALTAAPALAGDGVGGTRDRWRRPGDEGDEEAAAGAAVRARAARDGPPAVRSAGRHDLPGAVMATGHQASVPSDGGIMVSTAAMDRIRLHSRSSSVTVGPGVQWGPLMDKSSRLGLAGLAGSSRSVGVVGYTLGGGLSPALGRLHGYNADHVTRLEIVTADGELREATPEQEEELFWAARGGKGNFGIVTSMDFGLFEVRRLYAGALMVAAETAPEALRAWRDWAREVPESVTTSAAFVQVPPDAPLPEPVRGKLVLSLRVSHVGDADEGERLLAPLRDAGTVLADTVREMPFTDWGEIHSD